MSKYLILFCLIFYLFRMDLHAQCCSAGNPYFYSEQSILGHMQLQVTAGYKYSTSDTYYEGSQEISINDIEKAWFNYTNLQLLYGLNKRWNLQADLGYFINKSEAYYKEDWATKTGFGIGDAGMTVKYLAYKNFKHNYSIVPSVGMKFPVGVFDQEVSNVKLPITIQPSSGSFRYLVNLYINKAFKNPKWNLGFFGSFEYSQLINSENFYYKYGNNYLFSLIGSYKISRSFNLGLEIRSENRARSTRENSQVVESSGYNIVYVIPHLSYSFLNNWLLSLNAELPVFRYYNGIQLGNKFGVSASLICTFSCKTKLHNKNKSIVNY